MWHLEGGRGQSLYKESILTDASLNEGNGMRVELVEAVKSLCSEPVKDHNDDNFIVFEEFNVLSQT